MARLVTFLLGISACGSIASGQTGNAHSKFGTIFLTDAQKLDIVKQHNDQRRSTHSSNMRYMTWDGELAWIAESYGRKCRYRHNRNRRHSKYASVGENMYASSAKQENFNPSSAIRKWSSEAPYFNYYSRTCQAGKICGHYTQIVWATSFKVGCALTACDYLSEIRFRNSLLFICNYATSGNTVTGSEKKLLSVYEKGYPCSECKKGDYCRDLLCANSKRDFIEPPEDSREDKQLLGYIIAVAVLSLIVIVLIAWIIFREFRARLTQIRCCWKGRFQKVSKSDNRTSKPTNMAYSVPSPPDADKAIPLISIKSGTLEVTTDSTGTNIPETKLRQKPDEDDELSSRWESRISFPKPNHPAPRSPPPSVPAPVLIRP